MTIAPSLHAMASIPSSSQIGYTMSRSIISTYRVFRLSTQGGHKSCPYDLPSGLARARQNSCFAFSGLQRSDQGRLTEPGRFETAAGDKPQRYSVLCRQFVLYFVCFQALALRGPFKAGGANRRCHLAEDGATRTLVSTLYHCRSDPVRTEREWPASLDFLSKAVTRAVPTPGDVPAMHTAG